MKNQRAVMEAQSKQMEEHARLLSDQIGVQDLANEIARDIADRQKEANMLSELHISALNHQMRQQSLANVITALQAKMHTAGPHSGARDYHRVADELLALAKRFPHDPL